MTAPELDGIYSHVAQSHQELCNVAFHEDINTLLAAGYFLSGDKKYYPNNDERAAIYEEALYEIREALYSERWQRILLRSGEQ